MKRNFIGMIVLAMSFTLLPVTPVYAGKTGPESVFLSEVKPEGDAELS